MQRRGARRSPAVRHKQREKQDEEEAGLKPRSKRLAELDQRLLLKALMLQNTGWATDLLQHIASFVTIFASRLIHGSKRKQSVGGVTSVLDAEEMRQLCDSTQMTDSMVANIGVLLHRAGEDDYKFLGNALFRSASNAGNELATVVVMDNIYNTVKHTPGRLKERDVIDVLKALNEIASRGKNTGAAVLAGKIAHIQGDDKTAITLWKGAMDAAVAASEAARKANASGTSVDFGGAGFTDLSAPWIELSSVYYNRRDFANLQWAIDVGCEQDDPNSHFLAAQLQKDSSTVKSGWFHHITKAATSGHVRAMHELALWYAEFGWPFLEDEPPDDIKPTPFDRFPREMSRDTSPKQSSWQRLQTTLGFSPPAEVDPLAQAFQSAAYPSTPLSRLGMALEWMKVAMAFNYAPSYLATAGLLLMKTIDSSTGTPKEALELSHKRYTYASRADYYSNRKLPHLARNKEIKISNPYYNPDEAKRLTREVFYAKFALETHLHQVRNFHNWSRQTGNKDALQDIFEDDFAGDMGSNLRKWFRHPEVRELFMDERTGRLIDKERNDMDLVSEAKALCDDEHWDIYAEDGSLLYRHVSRKT